MPAQGRNRYHSILSLTFARDSVSRVARVARAVERALGVRAVGVCVAVVSVRELVHLAQTSFVTFIDVCRIKYMSAHTMNSTFVVPLAISSVCQNTHCYTWLRLQSSPCGTCSRTSPRCWCSWRQRGSHAPKRCADLTKARHCTHRYLKGREATSQHQTRQWKHVPLKAVLCMWNKKKDK